ncbi:hypothetical protein GH714_027832 [Hevea brasiliensis]|uniref:Wall-associated receptor kinase domain-containing protein n=1 Tax=Hevea brasiliensis TaxID=3981 RepID=A0A6A6LPP7_HEVBR|nr:hypothetical protein GH714_027832 [Hevea brasiliensis]
MIDQSLQRLGCESTCLGHKKNVDWRQMLPNFIEEGSSGNYWIVKDYCNGTDCCHVTIPSSLQVFNASFQAINNQSTDGCKLAFLAGTYGRNSWRKKDPNVQFPMVLDWMLYSNRTESYNWMINSGFWSGNYSESESLYCYSDGSSLLLRQQYSVVIADLGMKAILTFDAQMLMNAKIQSIIARE